MALITAYLRSTGAQVLLGERFVAQHPELYTTAAPQPEAPQPEAVKPAPRKPPRRKTPRATEATKNTGEGKE